MSDSQSGYFSKFLWTAGTMAGSAGLKFALNVTLSWLLSPAIMGVMVVVNAVRLGVDLLTDVGIEQNIIHHRDGLETHFRNVAWTMQVVRGAFLSILFAIASPFLANAYGIDVRIFLLASCSPVIAALHSTAIFALVKQLEVRRRSLFELGTEAASFVGQVGLALWLRSVWAPAIGILLYAVLRAVLSYRLPDAPQRFVFDPAIMRRIFSFGKWIAVTSLIMYAATNLDRLYLGKVTPLSLLGIYGIARAIAELPTTVSRRMSYQVIFPALAQVAHDERRQRLTHLGHSRMMFAGAMCLGLALAAGGADWLIMLIYDARYAAAGWMLSVLLMGAIFAVLSNLNEALLLGAGRPIYSSFANLLRLATLAVLLPGGFAVAGFAGAVIAVALTELLQYGYIAAGLVRVRLGYWGQDGMIALASFALIALVLFARHALGLGDPLAGMALVMR